MSTIQDDKNKWVESSNGGIPPGTMVGGRDTTGEVIYVARAWHNGVLMPGKLLATHYCTYISWDGKEFKKESYEALVGGSNKWKPTSGSNIPSGALPGGKTQTGETLYIGRVHHQGSITTGKVLQSKGVCYIPYGGKELSFTEYEILLY